MGTALERFAAMADTLAILFASKEELFESAERKFRQAIELSEKIPPKKPLILARVTKDLFKKY